MNRNFIALVLAVFMIVACQHVTVTTPEGITTKSRSFGAGTTSVATDGAITTESPGLSEGFTGVITYALSAVAAFFHADPDEEEQPIEITIESGPTCGIDDVDDE